MTPRRSASRVASSTAMAEGRIVEPADPSTAARPRADNVRLVGAVGFARTVAIKRLHPHLSEDVDLRSTIIDEARLAARIHHPNVTSTLDVVSVDGELLIVMEYVRGESLSRLVKSRVRETGDPCRYPSRTRSSSERCTDCTPRTDGRPVRTEGAPNSRSVTSAPSWPTRSLLRRLFAARSRCSALPNL
jgi:serine/threonine protein kinase